MNCILLLVLLFTGVSTLSYEKQIIKQLSDNYEKIGLSGRPVSNASETLTVGFGLALAQLIKIDEKEETGKLKVWARHTWKDVHLQWNPKEFGGIDRVRIPVSKIWKPDIILTNGHTNTINEAMAVVDNDGTVLWIPIQELDVKNAANLLYFPRDVQTMMFQFSSWTYDGFELDVDFFDNMDEVDVNDYVTSNEWKLLDAPAIKNIKRYPCCEEPYPDLTFFMKFERRPFFYIFVLVIPSVLLSSLKLLVYLMPLKSSDRSNYGIAMFAAFMLLLVIVADVVPRGMVSMPFIAFYLLLNILVLVVSLFLSSIVTMIYACSGKGKFGAFLQRMFCLAGCSSINSMKKNNGGSWTDAEEESTELNSSNKNNQKSEPTCGCLKTVARILNAILFVASIIVEIVSYRTFVMFVFKEERPE